MQEKTKFILGIDAGSQGLGLTVVETSLDEREIFAIKPMVRVFNSTHTKGDDFKENESKNAVRGSKKRTRRQISRRAERIRIVKRILTEYGLSDSTGKSGSSSRSRYHPYDIWAASAERKLASGELGEILLLMAHRRGFKSNRGAGMGRLAQIPEVAAHLRKIEQERQADARKKTKAEQKEEEGILEAIKTWREHSQNLPVGTIFFAIASGNLATLPRPLQEKLEPFAARNQVRNKTESPLPIRPDRAIFEQEFERILGENAGHLGLSPTQVANLRQALFFQRPLALPQAERKRCL
jgi:CRISPR/Cas system Type II protein with McrA/HNH and RuvC-like nuclease domain